MTNPRLIRKRVISIRNIGKITKALEMVSASRVQKAQDKALSAKPYADMIYELVGRLSGEKSSVEIPLLRDPKASKSDLIILISTNRGLAGSFNTNLFRTLHQFLKKDEDHYFITVGKKGRTFAMQNGKLEADFSTNNSLGNKVADIVKIVSQGFVSETYDEVYIAYSNFVTALSQEPVIKKILPIKIDEFSKQHDDKKSVVNREAEVSGFSFDPDPATVLNDLLPYYLEVQVADSLYEAEASEHSARMVAMKNATDNASEITSALSLEYNKARQDLITTELSDITTAQESLK